MKLSSLRESTRHLVEKKIGRRSFVARLAGLGIAPAAAASLASSLQAAEATQVSTRGRLLENLTGGEIMAEMLLEWKVPYIFGLGGSEEVGFLDALVDRIPLQYVLALHEGSALSIADGYARTSGETAFLNLHSVAGTGYALGPMVNAFKDRTPLVITAGRQSTDLRGSEAFLEAVNLHMLPREFTRWTWDVLAVETIPETLRRAFLLARVPPGGPTFVTFSRDLWERRSERTYLPSFSRSPVEFNLHADPEMISRAVDRLVEARFPLLVAGSELSRYGGIDQFVQIAEMLGAPVMGDVPSSHTPVSFPTTHPQYAGLFTLEADFPPPFDLFWSVGGTMFTFFQKPAQPLVFVDVQVLHASIEAAQIGRNYPVDVALSGNVNNILNDVLAELQTRRLPRAAVEERREKVVTYHQSRRRRLEESAEKVWRQSPISPERLAMELNRLMEPDALVVSEAATSDLFLWNYFDFHQARPGRTHLTSAGGCLGWGLGAAVGAKIGSPQRQVVLQVGDGSFHFGAQALWTAARYQVPLAIIVWNNNAYQANRRSLHAYGGRAAATGKYIGCYLGSPDTDPVQIARGYGVDGSTVSAPERLAESIQRCFRAVEEGRPYLLDVKIQPRFPGADSTWIDFFSVATGSARKS